MENPTNTLQRELQDLKAQINTLEKGLEHKPDYGLGTGAAAVTNWELDLAMVKRLRERVSLIEQTLSQTDQNAYGICKQCGEPIHPDRLAVLPDTRLCIQCARNEQDSK